MRRTAEDWKDYYVARKPKGLHPTYALLEPHLPSGGRALELGCGTGHGVLHLVEKGFEVVAVDAHAAGLDSLRADLPCDARATLIQSRFEDLDVATLGAFDVIVAGFSLFFMNREQFLDFWPKLRGAMAPGCVFMGQILGPNDTWAHECAVLDRAEVDGLLEGLDVLHLEEVDRDGETTTGEAKHWHVFHIVARVPR